MKCSDSWWMDAHICFLCLKSDSSGGISDDSIIHSWTSKSPFNRDMPNVDATDGIQNFCVQIQNLLNISIRMMYRSSWSVEVRFLWNMTKTQIWLYGVSQVEFQILMARSRISSKIWSGWYIDHPDWWRSNFSEMWLTH